MSIGTFQVALRVSRRGTISARWRDGPTARPAGPSRDPLFARRRDRPKGATLAGRCVSPRRISRGSAGDILGLDEAIGAVADRDRPFRIRAQRQARIEDGRLFLDAPRIGDHEPGAAHERDEVDVAERIDTRMRRDLVDPRDAPRAIDVREDGGEAARSGSAPRGHGARRRPAGRVPAHRRLRRTMERRHGVVPREANVLERTGRDRSRSRCASSVSIIGLPTNGCRSAGTPSWARLSSPSGLVTKAFESWSVTRRLISSGMSRRSCAGPLRRAPAGCPAWRRRAPRPGSSSRPHRRSRGMAMWSRNSRSSAISRLAVWTA